MKTNSMWLKVESTSKCRYVNAVTIIGLSMLDLHCCYVYYCIDLDCLDSIGRKTQLNSQMNVRYMHREEVYIHTLRSPLWLDDKIMQTVYLLSPIV